MKNSSKDEKRLERKRESVQLFSLLKSDVQVEVMFKCYEIST